MIAVGKFAPLEADFDWISSSQSLPDAPQIIVTYSRHLTIVFVCDLLRLVAELQ